MSSATLNFVLSKPNEAADHIDELENRLWRSSGDFKQAAARIEALEAALRRIRDDGKNCADHCRRQADRALSRAALAPEPWPQDAIDQEMIERTDDGWSLPPAEQDK